MERTRPCAPQPALGVRAAPAEGHAGLRPATCRCGLLPAAPHPADPQPGSVWTPVPHRG